MNRNNGPGTFGTDQRNPYESNGNDQDEDEDEDEDGNDQDDDQDDALFGQRNRSKTEALNSPTNRSLKSPKPISKLQEKHKGARAKTKVEDDHRNNGRSPTDLENGEGDADSDVEYIDADGFLSEEFIGLVMEDDERTSLSTSHEQTNPALTSPAQRPRSQGLYQRGDPTSDGRRANEARIPSGRRDGGDAPLPSGLFSDNEPEILNEAKLKSVGFNINDDEQNDGDRNVNEDAASIRTGGNLTAEGDEVRELVGIDFFEVNHWHDLWSELSSKIECRRKGQAPFIH